MYQTIIRDSGGEGLIRVVSVPCGPGRASARAAAFVSFCWRFHYIFDSY